VLLSAEFLFMLRPSGTPSKCLGRGFPEPTLSLVRLAFLLPSCPHRYQPRQQQGMSFACPSRHQSYASFRLAIFKSLFEPSFPQSPHSSAPSRGSIRRDGRQQHRAFRSSAIQPKQKGSRNFQNDQDLRAFMEERLMNNGNAPTPTFPPSATIPEATPESRGSAKLLKQKEARRFEPDEMLRTFVEKRLGNNGSPSTPLASTTTPEAAPGAISVDPEVASGGLDRPREPIQKRMHNVDDLKLRAFTEERLVKYRYDSTTPLETTAPEATPKNSRFTWRTKGSSRPWSPYSEAGREDLKGLVSGLKKISTEHVDFQKEYYEAPIKGARALKLDLEDLPMYNMARPIKSLAQLKGEGPPSDDSGYVEQPEQLSRSLPESPVMRRLRMTKYPKRTPTNQELLRLINNPWASLLASPVRQCHGTGVRLPVDLMVPWELVKRPSDQGVYLMPRQLAVLEKLKPGWNSEERHGGLWKSGVEEWKPSLKDPEEANSADGRETTSKLKDPKELKIMTRLLPYQPLTQRLTDRMIRKNSVGKVFTGKAAVERIIPHREKEKIKTFNHYTAQDEDILDLNNLQWQADIAERMKGIMRVRVLTTLETLGIEGGRRFQRTYILPIEALSTGHISLHFEEARSWYADYNFFASQRPPDTQESNSVLLGEMQEDIIGTFGGSIILHVNSREPASIPDQPTPVLSRLAPNMLPQTICLENTVRIPVFDLRQLMGKPSRNVTARRCRRVMQTYDILHPPRGTDTAEENENGAQNENGVEPEPWNEDNDKTAASESDSDPDPNPDGSEPYLLLITKREPLAHVFTKELWQLWRYVGGEADEKQDRDQLRAWKRGADFERHVQDDPTQRNEGS
jgi:hypothetical protein